MLVYRLGGTSHSASVVEVCSGMYRTVSTVNDSTFGSDIFTNVLKDFLATEFKRQASFIHNLLGLHSSLRANIYETYKECKLNVKMIVACLLDLIKSIKS